MEGGEATDKPEEDEGVEHEHQRKELGFHGLEDRSVIMNFLHDYVQPRKDEDEDA